jgi:hypothetical protein
VVTAVPLVTCASHVEGATPVYPRAAAKHTLLIPGVLRLGITPRLYLPGLGSRNADGFSYKIGISVNVANPGRSVRLTVSEPTARLVYPGARGRSIRFRACSPTHPRWRDGLPVGAWTGWPGGIVVTEATCVHVVVSSGTRSYKLALGLGVRCP